MIYWDRINFLLWYTIEETQQLFIISISCEVEDVWFVSVF